MTKRKGASQSGFRDILSRLRSDVRGNVLMLTAALLIPLCALIGSGIDLGRIYVVRSRMQVACDAASLAGRREVSSSGNAAQVSAESAKFFNYNFPQLSYGTTAFTPSTTISGDTTQVVTVTASTTLPMSMMQMFGFSSQAINVSCNAQQNFVNTDIVLVLDNTLSMNCAPGASATCSSATPVAGSKMAGMRSAVMALYSALSTAQTQLEAAHLRLRYSIIPYSSTVNIGKSVYGLNSGYIQATSPYLQNVTTCTRTQFGICTQSSTSVQPVNVTHPATFFPTAWNGCIEERKTNSTITQTSGSAIPNDANDLNFDLVPTTGTSATALATQWPAFDPVSETAYNTSQESPCPVAAQPLQAWSQSDLQAYMDSLIAGGGTLSDIGMIWAGRMLSRAGIWATLNPLKYGSMPVNRFVILMTDGGITAYSDYYTAYGVENVDHRVSGTPYPGATTDGYNHRQRFSMVCNAIKNQATSIWVIGFGQSFTGGASSDDTAALQNCASNSGQAAYISDSASLVAKFTQIGQAIGALRLTQ
jgi:Flp pilus assembly protein TadG